MTTSRLARMAFGGSFLWAAVGTGGQGMVARGSELARTGPALLAAAAGVAPKRQPEGQPAPGANAAPANTSATIVAVEGKVRYRLGSDKPWEIAKAGVTMGEGAEVETSLRSAVQIRIGEGQVLTIDRASRVAIREAIRRAGTEKTTVDLPYGRVKFEVSSASVANDVKIQAPDATLAVKGTKGFMEVTPGQPTLAAGDAANTGTFEVAYQGGTTATVTEEIATDAENQDPAANAVEVTQIDVGSPTARTEDETQVITRAPGGGESLVLVAPGVTGVRSVPPLVLAATDLVFLGTDALESIELQRLNVLSNELLTIRSGGPFSSSLDFDGRGLALGRSADGMERELFRLQPSQSGGGFELLGLTFGMPDSVFQLRTTISGQNITGLGALGGRLFTMGLGGTVDRQMLEISIGSGSLTPRSFLPFGVIGTDLAGSNERGTIWMFGAGSSRGIVTGFPQGGFFEIDPRTNHVLRATGPLVTGDTTVFDEGLSGSSLSGGTVVGLAFAAGNIIAQVQTEAGRLFVTINPIAPGTVSAPTITRVAFASGTLNGLASETFSLPAASAALAPLGPGVIDPVLNPLLSMMAVGPNAAASNMFQQMIIGQIIDTATDPASCAGSNVFGSFGPFLSANANRVGGVGLAVNQFRESLGNGHPCLFPGQMISQPPLLYLDNAGNLLGRTIAGVETVLRSGLAYNTSTSEVGGLAILAAGQTRLLFRLEAAPGGSASAGQVLSQLNLASAGATLSPIASYGTNGPLLGGLGSIGSFIYTGGIPRGGIDPFNEYTIYELTPTLSARLTIPFNFVDPEIAGSNERGTLFITGDADEFVPRGSIFEIDPRNGYLAGVTPIEFGPSTIVPPGLDLNILDQHDISVTGSAYIGNRLILGIRDNTTGARYFAEIDPNAAGTPAHPSIIRVTQSTRHILGLASEALLTPPTPLALSSPSSPIDTSLGLFADLAYSPAAAGNDAFRRLVANGIVISSDNPAACRSSISLPTLGSFLAGHANQTSGVGQAVNDFRMSLPGGHPCLVPGMAVGLDNQVLYLDLGANDLRVLGFQGEGLTSDGGFAANPFPSGVGVGTGIALSRNGQGAIFHLQSAGSPGSITSTLRSVPIANPASTPAIVTTLSGVDAPVLFGLGVIDDPGQTRFFAPGFGINDVYDGIYEIMPGNAFKRVTSLPGFSLAAAFTGSNVTGSVFAIGTQDILQSPQFSDFRVLDIDPRNNFLRDVNTFSVDASTGLPPGFDPNTITDIVGLSFINGRLVMSVVTSGNQRAFLIYNPPASGVSGDPSVRSIVETNNFPISFASNIAGPAANPAILGAETNFPDLRIDPAFASLGYGGSTRVRDAARGFIERFILDNASNGQCAGSSEFANLAGLVGSHAGQNRGAGQVLGDFYNSIDYLHPCQVTTDLNRYIAVDESSLTVRQFDISFNQRSTGAGGTISPINPANPFGSPVDGGLALYQTFATGSIPFLFRLESTRLNATTSSGQFFWAGPGETLFQIGSPILVGGGAILSGLGVVGDRMFTGVFGVSSNTIREINLPTVAPTLGATFVDIPNLGFGGTIALGSVAQRGSLLASANIEGSLGILEIDPRNNYLADAYSVVTGQITIDGNTANSAPGFTSFFNVDQVTALAHNNGLITVHGRRTDASGNIVFTIDTGGTNGTARPIVGATAPGISPIGPFGAASTLTSRPLAPINLPDPGGAIDLRGLTAQFADLAYSQRALNSGVVGSITRQAIINSAVDASGCAGSSELSNGLGPILQNRVAQRAGVGRAITDFRNSLPGGHPCLPPAP